MPGFFISLKNEYRFRQEVPGYRHTSYLVTRPSPLLIWWAVKDSNLRPIG